MNELLPAIELETAPAPAFTVIWLHGLGADGSDFVPVVPGSACPRRQACASSFRMRPPCRSRATAVT